MKKNKESRSTLTPAPHKDAIKQHPDQARYILTGEVIGTAGKELSSAQLIRSLFEGSITPSIVVLRIKKLNCKEESDFKSGFILPCPTESESVSTVCNSVEVLESTVAITSSAQTSKNGEGLSC